MVGPRAKTHNRTLNQHGPRNLHKPKVTTGATSGLCGNVNLPILANISRTVGPTAKRHSITLNRMTQGTHTNQK